MRPGTGALVGFLTADAVSLTGTRVSQIAVPWLVLTTTGSASRTGVVAFAEMAPLVVAQVLGGPWIDRAGPRRVAVTFDVASGVAVGLVPLMYATGRLGFGLLVGLVALTGLLRGPSDVAHHAMVPSLVRHVGLPTERVTGLVGTIDRLGALVGAAVAGGVVAALGPADALLLNSASFVLCALVLAASTGRVVDRGTSTESPSSRTGGPSAYLREVRGGWDVLRADPILLGILVMVAVTNLLDQGYTAVMLPVWAHDSGNGPGAIGLLGACMGGAALVGSLIAVWRGDRLPRFRTYVIGYLVAGAPRWAALAFGLPLWAVAAVHVVAGFGAGFINPVLGAVQFERIPEDMMGRASAISLAASWSLMPLGGLLAGLTVGGVGLVAGLLVFGTCYLVATLAPALSPAWRAMDDRGSAEPAVDSSSPRPSSR
ncbi:Major Facilitator Superfamily protein [Nocardioides terrae]|uniref:Major Facilitator Superfamily protein n=1 Tax=Nocardioides terrae TaxID=574651 RepID=A0A1I1MV67_9ACTN|nr:MFS transporter [Nocardioides terrae]SFC89344.1 Major Facilitator Superfamily protein [Nocardioides terrae]